MPTNFENINYLNIESSGAKKTCHVDELIEQEEVQRFPLILEYLDPENRIMENSYIVSRIAYEHCDMTQLLMSIEYKMFWLLRLIHEWDTTKFQKVLHYQYY